MSKDLTIFFFLFLFSCAGNTKQEPETIQIGRQTWMKTNLDLVTFRNGDTIPEAKSNEAWEQARFTEKPAWSYFKNDPANGLQSGKLYNWYAVNDPRGLAPIGWHIPDDKDWTELLENTNGKMFSVQRAGTRTFIGEFENEGMGYWWSANGNESHDIQYAWYRVVGKQDDSLHRNSYVKGSGFSVRVLKRP